MWYGTGSQRKETEFTFDAQKQSTRWVEVIARTVTEPYGYQVTFVDKNNQRIEEEPKTARSKTLILNYPLLEELEVAVVPAGSFGPGGLLSQVVVALRYHDPANDYRADDLITLTKEGESKFWKVPLLDKNLREYEYLVTIFYSDGVQREIDWRKTDKTILPAGEEFSYRVDILPYLLKTAPGGYQFGTVHLTFDDRLAQPPVHAEKTLQVTDFTKPLVWRFRLGAPDRHTYKYQLTLFKSNNERVELPPTEESREVLVLPVPAVV
jgi:hypothetical protein